MPLRPCKFNFKVAWPGSTQANEFFFAFLFHESNRAQRLCTELDYSVLATVTDLKVLDQLYVQVRQVQQSQEIRALLSKVLVIERQVELQPSVSRESRYSKRFPLNNAASGAKNRLHHRALALGRLLATSKAQSEPQFAALLKGLSQVRHLAAVHRAAQLTSLPLPDLVKTVGWMKKLTAREVERHFAGREMSALASFNEIKQLASVDPVSRSIGALLLKQLNNACHAYRLGPASERVFVFVLFTVWVGVTTARQICCWRLQHASTPDPFRFTQAAPLYSRRSCSGCSVFTV